LRGAQRRSNLAHGMYYRGHRVRGRYRMDWQFVGNIPDNYERYLVPSIFAPWAHDLVSLARLRAGERALDVACGTGIVARIAAQTIGDGNNIVGLDLSGPMLSAARAAAADENKSIEWREGSAVELPLADATFDVVFCQQGLQFFPDRAKALSEMHRVLALGGRLVLSVWRGIEKSPGFAALADALTHHISSEASCKGSLLPVTEGIRAALRGRLRARRSALRCYRGWTRCIARRSRSGITKLC
jgi:ubiquinone/menaquinone biosynthesis C-methylase UbiE